MAYQATSWAWSLRIPFGKKIVLLALADMADEEFSCYPGQKRLSSMASMSVSTVARALEGLEEDGLIRREPRFRENGSRTSDRFYLNVPPLQFEGTPPFSLKGPPLQVDGGKNLPTESVTPQRARASQMPAGLEWTNAHSLKAVAKGVDVEVEFQKFTDYHLAKGSKFVDWDRAFHTWLNNARPDPGFGQRAVTGGGPHPSPPRRSRDDEIKDFLGGSLGLDDMKEIGQ